MKKRLFKKIFCHILAAGMVISSFSPAGNVKAAEGQALQSAYVWENHDRHLEYPKDLTAASSNTSQNGYGPEKMLDGNDNSRWEAAWNNPPKTTELTLGTKSEQAEYFTGMKYTSRLDNNISGSMSQYKFYKSENGSAWEEIPNMQGKIIQKLGTFYFIFDEPVKAKSIKIESDVMAVSEMRLLYIPTKKEDYDALKAEAKELRKEAGDRSGEDIGLWKPSSLEAFDEGMQIVEGKGEPATQEGFAETNSQILELYSDLKRAQLAQTTELNQELTYAKTLLGAAVIGTEPLTYSEDSVEAFRQVIQKTEETADNGAAPTGMVQDAKKLLEDGLFVFKLAQTKPEITYTGTPKTELSYLMDELTESHFQGSGTGEQVYLELDYKTELEFSSLEFKTWFATQQSIKKIKVDCKDAEGNWVPVDGGKEYSMDWITNVNVSETKTVKFEIPAKGTALRIYILQASSSYVIDELLAGIFVSEADVSVALDKESVTLSEGESGRLKATVLPQHVSNKNVTYQSSNERILKVNDDGTITAVALPDGSQRETVTVTVTTEYGKKTAQCEVTVIPKAADETDKRDTQTRLSNARKLADAAKAENYKEGAIDAFGRALDQAEEKLAQNVTVGMLAKLNEEIAQAGKEFEKAYVLPVRETKNLIDRITGAGSGDRFIIEMIPEDEATGNDVYEISWNASAKKPVLRGNDGVSLATAYNYYLKYFAYLDFPYVGDSELKLPEELPEVTEDVRIVFPYEYRHYFNENCEYKYTADLYGEEEWQHRIDWMAMNGFNMFLLDLGEHAVWYNAREELGLKEEAIDELLHYSNGTEQYYGKYGVSLESVLKEGELAKKVANMAFCLGMEPEVRPFIGQVPFVFPAQHEAYYGKASQAKMTISLEGSVFDGMLLYAAARWMNLPQGVFISPETAASDRGKADEMKEKFYQISEIYYASLMKTLGYEEWGKTPAYVYKDLVGEQGFVVQHEAFPQKVLGDMSDALMKLNPDAVWLQTSWRYQSWLPQYYRDGQLMFVDLSAENRPKWTSNDEFGKTPWLWSMLFNFGGNTGMEGDLKGLAEDVLSAKESAKYMKGVSISPEGGDTNPALYAMMAEMTWRSEEPDMDKWVQDYVKRRYGLDNYAKADKELDKVWEVLCGTVYKGFVSFDGPAQTLVNAYPKLSGSISRVYGSNAKLYQTRELLPAWKAMLDAAEKMESRTKQFDYDLVDLTRQILADLSGEIYANIKPAYDAGDKETAMEAVNQMIQLCGDLDEILATNKYFMAGTRLEGAKGRGVTQTDKDFYEQVERTFMTYWILDDTSHASLTDYCNRHLSGLMTDYYGMRWGVFAKYLEQAFDEGLSSSQFTSQMTEPIRNEICQKEEEWSKSHTSYPTEETGDSFEISGKIYEKYQSVIAELFSLGDETRDLPAEEMTAYAGNEHTASEKEGPASNVLDKDRDTLWHTAWAGSERSVHWIDISLGEEKIADGLRYLPRKGGGNGTITEYEIYVSSDNGGTYEKVCDGTWEADASWKTAEFSPVKATNVKLQSVNAVTDKEALFASAAEIRITTNAGEYTALQSVWNENKGKEKQDYTEETWKTFEAAMTAAEETLAVLTTDKETLIRIKENLEAAAEALEASEQPDPDPDKPDPDPDKPDPDPDKPDPDPDKPDPDPGKPDPDPDKPDPDPDKPDPNPDKPDPDPDKPDPGPDKPNPDNSGVNNMNPDQQGGSGNEQTGQTEPIAGQKVTDKKTGGVYRILNVNSHTAEYTAVKKKTAKVSVPDTVVLKGQKYKVVSVADSAFSKNKKLKNVTIGKNVKTIGKKAFYQCTNLNRITIKSKVLKKVGKNAFKGIHAKTKIKAPKSKLKAYQKLLKKKGQGKQVKIL